MELKNKLPLNIKATEGNGYTNKDNGVLPKNLEEATQQFSSSEISKELFGETFVKHFTETRLWECQQAQKAVTSWELQRYFEII